MITEPEFPLSFLKFISSILTLEKDADKTKAQIDSATIEEIYRRIDTLETGHIFLEDFYTFMKLHHLSVSKRELKFLNKYFGFDSKQSLTMEEFKTSFLQIRDPKSITEQYCESPIDKFIEYLSLVIESYSKIEDLRTIAADDLQELKSSLQKYYNINGSVLTKEIMKECLCDMGLYSRLNFAIVCHYVIGDQASEVNLRQLFWKDAQATLNVDSKLHVRSLSKKESKVQAKTPLKKPVPSISQNQSTEPKKQSIPIVLKADCSDILSQIENIESTIRYKKQIYAQRTKNLELDEQNKQRTVGTLVKRASANSSVDNADKREKRLSKFSEFNDSQIKIPAEPLEKKVSEEESIEPIVNQSKKVHRSKYSFEMNKQDDAPYQMRDIDDLLKNRMSVKTKEQVLNKAATCAQLKIQQIEKRVMGKLTNKITSTKASDYIHPLVSDLRSQYGGSLRSRYSSLKRE